MTRKISKILIANRGEIACRIIRSCKDLKIKTVALYSSADEYARHKDMADEAHYIGPAPAIQSYLNIQTIIDIAKKTGADAVHPGYGFLSENTDFAQKLADHDIIFIGPKAHSIDAMGDKAKAKALMEKAGVPLVPGYHGDDQSPDILLKHARTIGFPVLLKAAAGGGGKGMRLVESEHDFNDALDAAKREAQSSFGDDVMLVEKYVINPRHIEIQVFGDTHGNIIHLNERDCSLQRRHQKVIEEAPAFGMSADLRARMGGAAIKAAQAVDYVGAGTVEFLLDERGDFYFMEMNTRLQVEHPVTEMITGLDLVEWQIRVAQGEKLPLKQSDIGIDGHAIEARLYAEDPHENFMPQAGTIHHFVPPNKARIDSALRPVASWRGDRSEQISVFYDPMMAKIIAHGENRRDAIAGLLTALDECEILGIKTNRDFLRACLKHDDFQAEKISTKFIDSHLEELLSPQTPPLSETSLLLTAALAVHAKNQKQAATTSLSTRDPLSPWNSVLSWRMNQIAGRTLMINDKKITLKPHDEGVMITLDKTDYSCDVVYEIRGLLTATIDGKNHIFSGLVGDNSIDLFIEGDHVRMDYKNPLAHKSGGHAHNDNALTAPMPAKITGIFVKEKDSVKMGDKLMIVEAMKMEHTIRAPKDGVIKTILAQTGAQVDEGTQLIEMQG